MVAVAVAIMMHRAPDNTDWTLSPRNRERHLDAWSFVCPKSVKALGCLASDRFFHVTVPGMLQGQVPRSAVQF